jgi:HK97 gp10 family phage protein
MSRPRMTGNVKAKLSISPASYAEFKEKLKELQKAARKEVIEIALKAGGTIIHSAAQSKAPGPFVVMQIVGGRSLRKRVDPKFTGVVKSNGKFVAIGPDKKHWYYRFSEFGAKPHDIKPNGRKVLAFKGEDGQMVFVRYARNSGGVQMRPFLRPAVDNNSGDAVAAMANVLRREIEKAARS